MISEELQKLERLALEASRKLLETKQENEHLKKQLMMVQNILGQKEQELEHFKNKIKISNIVDNRPVNPRDSSEMSDLINNYIQEIDHLIAYLSE
jgi:uncharacterized protein involved in exopolysaccharide biosynthesis